MSKTRTPRDNNYISKSYQDRIEVNLANISCTKNDKFILTGMSYIIQTFSCELCNHNPCLYAFHVKNTETNSALTVGSECIKHFKDQGCNIDLASGLKKRVKSITRKMRRYMKKYMDSDDYKNLTVEEKREFTVKLFMKHQTKEQLRDEGAKKARLTEQEVVDILK